MKNKKLHKKLWAGIAVSTLLLGATVGTTSALTNNVVNSVSLNGSEGMRVDPSYDVAPPQLGNLPSYINENVFDNQVQNRTDQLKETTIPVSSIFNSDSQDITVSEFMYDGR